jgi:zinc D-Ala-D-Ala carboxypeptidase
MRWGYEEQFTPPQNVIDNLTALAVHVLQPIRDKLGAPLKVTSAYRCPRVNAAIGGRYDIVKMPDGTTQVRQTSQHVRGQAADIEFWKDGVERNDLLVKAIKELGLVFDQCIKEYGTETQPDWVHISFKTDGENRQQVLRAVKVGKKTTYNPSKL